MSGDCPNSPHLVKMCIMRICGLALCRLQLRKALMHRLAPFEDIAAPPLAVSSACRAIFG